MIDREKVIKGLECCAIPGGDCPECPYDKYGVDENGLECENRMAADALELLKAQEPRALTIEEVKVYPTDKALWFEGWTIDPVLPDCRVEQQYEYKMGVVVLDTFFDFPFYFDSYNIPCKSGWRCWSSRPTDEQREAVPWTE